VTVFSFIRHYLFEKLVLSVDLLHFIGGTRARAV